VFATALLAATLLLSALLPTLLTALLATLLTALLLATLLYIWHFVSPYWPISPCCATKKDWIEDI
jgi:hypothetical protein